MKAINNVRNTIIRYYNPDTIILFGSHAWGKPHKDSDIDILIIKKGVKKRGFERRGDVMDILRKYSKYNHDIDIFVLNQKDIKEAYNKKYFVTKILNDGKILYQKRV